MNWRLAPTIGLVAVLAPAMAHAQTNLDQGKSASQIFAAACVECHKAPRGLGKGKNSAALTDFLVEHYTTSRAQAAALAAYVLGGRGAEPIGGAAQGKAQKPPAERADRGAPAQEETKPSRHQARPSKLEEGARSDSAASGSKNASAASAAASSSVGSSRSRVTSSPRSIRAASSLLRATMTEIEVSISGCSDS